RAVRAPFVQGQLLCLSLFKVFLSFADLSLDFACAGFDTSFASQPGAASGGSGGLFDLSFNFFDTTLGFVFCAWSHKFANSVAKFNMVRTLRNGDNTHVSLV